MEALIIPIVIIFIILIIVFLFRDKLTEFNINLLKGQISGKTSEKKEPALSTTKGMCNSRSIDIENGEPEKKLNLIEYSGKRDFSIIRNIAVDVLNKSRKNILHIYMTNFDLKKQESLRDDWNTFFKEHGKQVYQHLFYCIRCSSDCDFILEQVEIIKKLKVEEKKPINYELIVIFDNDQTELNPWSILVLGDRIAFLSHDTKDDKKLSLQCYSRDEVNRIKSLWESYREKDNRLLYSKQDGLREENIKYLQNKKLFYLNKSIPKSVDVYALSEAILSVNLFLSKPVGCYLTGSMTTSRSNIANDIDLVFLFAGEPRLPEKMFNHSLLHELSSKFQINISLNGIPFIDQNEDYPTVDLLCDWFKYIQSHDSVSVIDIAKSQYEMIFGNEDAYSKLKGIELSKNLMLSRIETSYKYVKRNCTSQKVSLIKIAAKQFLQSFSMIEHSDFEPTSYIQSLTASSPANHYKPVLAYYSPESYIGSSIVSDILHNYNYLKTYLNGTKC